MLDLSHAPKDPVERVIWLDAVMEVVRAELELAYAEAYYEARLQRRFDAAVQAGRTAKKSALRLTRQENVRRGKTVRWGDGADPVNKKNRID